MRAGPGSIAPGPMIAPGLTHDDLHRAARKG